MDYKKYSDKYFIRSKEILEKENFNPWVKIQCFIRKGPGKIKGINEAVEFLKTYSDIEAVNGKIYGLKELSDYNAGDTIMTLEAPLQSIIEFETIYLGIISAETTKLNDKININLDSVRDNMRKIVDLAGKRPVMYFGSRHWRYDEDAAISKAAFEGGASGCSTDIGAETVGKKGEGTIPHALVLAYASKYSIADATVKATEAFDEHIEKDVKRIALVDTFNKEMIDSLAVSYSLGKHLFGVRIDTCGENFAEGSDYGKGVTIEVARNVRVFLNQRGFKDVKIILSSGFANPEKVQAFVEAEKKLGIQLFDGLGVGQIFDSRTVTADIMEVDGKPLSKTGRKYKPNDKLIKLL